MENIKRCIKRINVKYENNLKFKENIKKEKKMDKPAVVCTYYDYTGIDEDMNYYIKIKLQEREEELYIHRMEIFKLQCLCLSEHKQL